MVTVFGCSIVPYSMSKNFYFSMISNSLVILFDCVIDFNTNFMSPLFALLQFLMLYEVFQLCF